MDPLTHTLVGANLAATRLGEKTRLATAALVIGANLPDVDSILYFTNHDDLALGFRRGWTHGVLALVVLPLIQTALLLLYARLRPDPQRPVNARWLLILSALAILTHPFLDWLNNYGMRWLMPFDGTWFYGDSVFIMDPWLWLVLGAGWLAGKRASPLLFALWLFFAAAISWIVYGRAPVYLPIVLVVALVLLAALFWRAPRSLATIALAIACAYIGARLTIHAITANAVRKQVAGIRRTWASSAGCASPSSWRMVSSSRSSTSPYGRCARPGFLDVLAPDEAHHDHIRGEAEGKETAGVKPDRLLRDANPNTYDGLVIPGGLQSPQWMRASGPHLAWVRRMFERGKPVAAICHGPWLLAAADVAGGRVVTSHKDCRTDLEQAGARWVDQEVVVDRGLVTSRTPADLPAFVSAYLQLLEREYTELACPPTTTVESIDGGGVQLESGRATAVSVV